MALPPLNAPLRWKNQDAATVALLEDLQANILKGHGRDHTINLFLTFDETRKIEIKRAIHQLSGQLTTAHQQLVDAERFKLTGKPGGIVRCFFLSFAGYAALGSDGMAPPNPPPPVGPGVTLPPAFAAGAASRAGFLNDEPFSTWDAMFQQPIHAMLLLADDDIGRLTSDRDSVVASLQAVGVTLAGEQPGLAQRNARGDGVEHFGYVDGRSQPLLLAEDVDNERLGNDGTSMWDPAFPLDQVLVTDDPANPTAVLGSFFVFRKLEQNVSAFKDAEAAVARNLGLRGDDREVAGAYMVGRFEDGTPVVLRKEDGIGGDVPNNFNYDDDGDASKCPFHAHIRKTNPRGSGGFETHALERRHIMARRGITYGDREPCLGDRPEGDVGLLFMAYQSSIDNQFEFTQKNWANSSGFPNVPPGRPSPGIDPVIGQGTTPPNTQHCPVQWGAPGGATQPQSFQGFVKMKGGEYFFAPVISTLRTL